MSGLLQVLNFLSPKPQPPASVEYDGLEYKWKIFTFRPALFKFEAVMFAALAAYLGWFMLGKYLNTQRANSTIRPLRSFIDTQFLRTRDLLSSGPAQHLLYSTGRRNALSLHTTIFLYPIHDLVALITHVGKSIIEPTYDGSESLLFNLTLGRGDEGRQGEALGVWAITDKSEMRPVKEKRWDLTFARLQENPAVPITHSLFTEHSDVNDALLKTPNVGIVELLRDNSTAGVLKYLIITDQPATRPPKGILPPQLRKREIVLSVRKPSGKAQEDAVKAWLQVILNIADLIGKPNVIKPEVTRKLAKTREQVESDLVTEYAKERREETGALSKEEQQEERRLAKKRAERASMSEKELKKLEELEKKRAMRKQAKKQQ